MMLCSMMLRRCCYVIVCITVIILRIIPLVVHVLVMVDNQLVLFMGTMTYFTAISSLLIVIAERMVHKFLDHIWKLLLCPHCAWGCICCNNSNSQGWKLDTRCCFFLLFHLKLDLSVRLPEYRDYPEISQGLSTWKGLLQEIDLTQFTSHCLINGIWSNIWGRH